MALPPSLRPSADPVTLSKGAPSVPQRATGTPPPPALATATQPKSLLRYWPWALGTLCAAAGGYLLWGYFAGGGVTPAAVTRNDVVQTIVANGQVETALRVNLGSQIAGVVALVSVDVGANVVAGQTLLELDSRDARGVLAQAQAAVRQAEARLATIASNTLPAAQQLLTQAKAALVVAEETLRRVKNLASKGFASAAQLEEAQRAFEVAQSQVRAATLVVESASPEGGEVAVASGALDAARASLQSAEAKLRLTQIVSPADGRIISRTVEAGQVVQPGIALLSIAPRSGKRIVVQIDERNLALIAIGQSAIASADAFPAARFAAVLAVIEPSIDVQRGSVEVKFDVAEPPAYLLENMTVSVDIEVAHRTNALTLPAGYVHDAAGTSPYVLLAVNGRAERRAVKIGARGPEALEILDGVSEGELALAVADSAIVEGSRVTLNATPAV
jgi:HlyD family secretion protein